MKRLPLQTASRENSENTFRTKQKGVVSSFMLRGVWDWRSDVRYFDG